MVAPWKNIDSARRASGLNLKEMAGKCGVSETAVQNWKRGGAISLNVLIKLSDVLNVSVDELLGKGSIRNESDTEAQKTGHEASRPRSRQADESTGNAAEKAPLREPPLCYPITECSLSEHSGSPYLCEKLLGRMAALESGQAKITADMRECTTKIDTLTRLLGASLRAAQQRGDDETTPGKQTG